MQPCSHTPRARPARRPIAGSVAFAALAAACALALLVAPRAARAQCDLTIFADTLRADYVGAPVGFCTDLDYRVALRSDRFVDGVRQTDIAEGCAFDSLTYYPYATFPGGGIAGPYSLDAWTVDGQAFATTFADVADLVSQMNGFDPLGFWIEDPFTRTIVGGRGGVDYGAMRVTQTSTGTSRDVNPSFQTVANGTLVTVDGAGFHEFVVDDPTDGCRDTLVLLLEPRVDEIRFDVFADFETATEVFCLDNSALLGNPQAYTLCDPDAPRNGALTDVGGYCFTYLPAAGFTGSDPICFEVCDDTPAPAGPLCQRTIVDVITRSPSTVVTDTVRVRITNADTAVCLNPVLDLPTPYDVAELCAPAPAGLTALAALDGCVSLQPDVAFSGTVELCVRYCTGATCDTTVVAVTVLPDCDLGMFVNDRDTVASQGDPTPYCLPQPVALVSGYEVTVDGAPYGGPLTVCDLGQQFFYNYAALFDMGNAGPYTLQRWTVDGVQYNGTFQDPPALETLMRAFDPAGNWRLDVAAFNIEGGAPGADYGMMVIVHNQTGTVSELRPNPIDEARGTAIELPGDGTYRVGVRNPADGCTDAVTVTVGQGPDTTAATTTRELTVVVRANEPTASTCLFPAPRDTFSLCGDVRNGSVAIDAALCAVYTPAPGFVGLDTLCAVSCDLPGGTVCDTTIVVYDVRAEVIRVPVTNFGDDPFTTCLTPPFPGPYGPAIVCGASGPFSAGTSATNGCVDIDPAAGADTDGTVCVVLCQEANPAVCQEFLIEITQLPACAPPLFAADTLFLDASADTAFVCLADGADLSAFDITLDGAPYAPLSDPDCGTTGGGGGGTMRDAYFYGTFLLNDGPYVIDLWEVNGRTITGVSANSFAALADSMSARDPDLDWVYDEVVGGIVASGATGAYSTLVLFDVTFAQRRDILLETIRVSGGGGGSTVPGAVVAIPSAGLYEVVASSASCGERLVIVRAPAQLPTRDTLRVFAEADRLNGPYCLDVSELPGPPTSIASCGDPADGTLGFASLECVEYTPDAGFSGSDTACVVVCASGGLVCDTTVVIFDVVTQVLCPDFLTSDAETALAPTCDEPTLVCLPSLPDEFFFYSVSVDGQVRADAVACGADTVNVYSYADVAGRGLAGPYGVEGYRLRGETFDAEVADVVALADSLNRWDPRGDWVLNPINFTLRGGVSGTDYDTLVLRQIATDTINRIAPLRLLTENRIGVPLDTGSYSIVVNDNRTGCADTIAYRVTCGGGAECDDLTAPGGTEIVLDDCGDTGAFTVRSGPTDPATLRVFVDGTEVAAAVDDSTLTVFLDTGAYEVTVLDDARACTSAFAVVVTCGPCGGPLPAVLNAGADCARSAVRVCLPVAPAVLATYALELDGAPYGGPTEPCDERDAFEIDLAEFPGAGAGGPYAIDSFRIDGRVFATDIAAASDLVDTLNRWDATGAWRLDTAALLVIGGNPVSSYGPLAVTQIATSASATVALTPVRVAGGTAIDLPAGTTAATLRLDNGVDCVQEVAIAVTCVTAARDTVRVDVGGQLLYCVDPAELTGPVVDLVNVCPEAGAPAAYDFDGRADCVTVSGVREGVTEACLVACDASGVCDTTYLTVVVGAGGGGAVVANDDEVRLRRGETRVVSVTDNDVFTVLTSARIVTPPTRGAGFLGADGVLTYTPDQDECGFTDSLTYEICEGALCDTATVRLRVRCGLVEPYNAFSPNGDGVNETFVIEGIEEFPEAVVRVYNRWGNLVFEAADYDNRWDGTWDGNRLVDGTYFYLVSIPGEEEIAGWVMVYR